MPSKWRFEAIRYRLSCFWGVENFRKSKNIRKFEKAKNMIKSKMSFVVKRGNDSTSVDCHNMLKKWKVKCDKQSYYGYASRFLHI
ncbi:hypothetical protein HanRHA438_Chr07g0291051 [Helianthus annuus]|nr:hypothetical protein HanRHA438_Chr07g0291051 [Helianthus annuus]